MKVPFSRQTNKGPATLSHSSMWESAGVAFQSTLWAQVKRKCTLWIKVCSLWTPCIGRIKCRIRKKNPFLVLHMRHGYFTASHPHVVFQPHLPVVYILPACECRCVWERNKVLQCTMTEKVFQRNWFWLFVINASMNGSLQSINTLLHDLAVSVTMKLSLLTFNTHTHWHWHFTS